MSIKKDSRLIQPYLTFRGRCDEAIEFYRQALDASVEMVMRFKDSPEPLPPGALTPDWENKIMHASLRIGEVSLMLSDGCPLEREGGFQGFSLSLTVGNEAEAGRVFAALSQTGKVNMPLGRTFWSPCFGMVEDKFGVRWMVTVAAANPK
ncbi:MAG: VOC family protein [Limisphaerales bacterium]